MQLKKQKFLAQRVENRLKENQEVMDAFLSRDEQSMKFFYHRQWPKVRSLTLTMGGDTESAKDVMQNAFLLLYENVRDGKYKNQENANISTYFLGICRFILLNDRRSAHKKRVTPIDNIDHERIPMETSELKDRLEEQKEFRNYFDLLGEKCKEILKAYYWGEYSVQEIAEMAGLTYESAKNAKYRCMTKLRMLMSDARK